MTSAKLRLYVTGKADADDRNLIGEWYTAANWPIDSGDWTLNPGTNALAGADITSLTLNTSADLTLSSPANISLTGPTGLRLGVSGGQPTGDNYFQIAALEHNDRPRTTTHGHLHHGVEAQGRRQLRSAAASLLRRRPIHQ